MSSLACADLHFAFDNSYARLPERFYVRQAPVPVRAPQLLQLNEPLARALGLDPDALRTPEGVEILAGNKVPAGADPIAQAYAGHQFAHFVPQLGDGRAVLLGEIITPDGARRDLQLKGAGRTPFSRGGDGRAPLGPVLREYLVSEAMQALGIATTRALAAVASGELVMRETPLPGGILARVAQSHVRVGTLQYFAARGDTLALAMLADHVIARHYPAAEQAAQPYLALLAAVSEAQAALVAQWMCVGFIHGVMNTDNCSLAGETLDYGPCAFMDSYHPGTVYSYIDQQGRYAFGNQPAIAQWNLARLRDALAPLLGGPESALFRQASEIVEGFADSFRSRWREGMGRKLGLRRLQEGDEALITGLLDLMRAAASDYTVTFRTLCAAATASGEAKPAGTEGDDSDAELVRQLGGGEEARAWLTRWRARLAREEHPAAEIAAAMRRENPAYVARNHQVEKVLAAAVDDGDMEPFRLLLRVLQDPFREQPGAESFALPPRPEEQVHRTFCGT